MKKSIILALVMSGVLIFSSCEKDKEPITNPATNQTVSTAQMTDEQVEAKIIDFIAKVENGDKSTESMSIEDAVWNIEAALNYTFCVNEVELVPDTTIVLGFDYPSNTNGELSFLAIADLFRVYKKEIEKTKAKYIALVDIDLNDMTVSYNIAKSFDNAKTYTGDDMRYGDDQGNCEDREGTEDAAYYIKQGIQEKFYPPGVYYTGITNRTLNRVRNDDYSSPNYYNNINDSSDANDLRYDYVPFARYYSSYADPSEANGDYCIEESIISYYIERTYDVMNSQDGDPLKSPCGWYGSGYSDYAWGQITNYPPYHMNFLHHLVSYNYGTHHIASR